MLWPGAVFLHYKVSDADIISVDDGVGFYPRRNLVEGEWRLWFHSETQRLIVNAVSSRRVWELLALQFSEPACPATVRYGTIEVGKCVGRLVNPVGLRRL